MCVFVFNVIYNNVSKIEYSFEKTREKQIYDYPPPILLTNINFISFQKIG